MTTRQRKTQSGMAPQSSTGLAYNPAFDCPHCGEHIAPVNFELFDKVRAVPGMCRCEGAVLERERSYEREREHHRDQVYYHAIMSANGIHLGKYRKMRFGTWDDSRHAGAKKHRFVVEQYCTEQKPGSNLLWLWGAKKGTGKTHLALAALRQVTKERALDEVPVYPYFVEWIAHCAKIQQSWKREGGESGMSEGQLWGKMSSSGLLVLDDLDKRYPSEWAMGELYKVINHRYNMDRPLIVTANQDINTLKRVWEKKGGFVWDIGEAIIDRLVGQLWKQVKIEGKSSRSEV